VKLHQEWHMGLHFGGGNISCLTYVWLLPMYTTVGASAVCCVCASEGSLQELGLHFRWRTIIIFHAVILVIVLKLEHMRYKKRGKLTYCFQKIKWAMEKILEIRTESVFN
jgi:hypothetical protein